MKVLEYPANASPKERGRIHGESFRHLIKEIAEIRTELCITLGSFTDSEQVMELAKEHLPLLHSWQPDLYAELYGISEGADLSLASIVVLNHYTDLRDLNVDNVDRPSALPPILPEKTYRLEVNDISQEDCSAANVRTERANLLGQTWDMHASAEPYVLMLKTPESNEAPASWLLSITGCLGMAGLNSQGVGITINNLRSTDAKVGAIWPAVVRAALKQSSAIDARDVIMDATIGSGHHYMVSSAELCFGIETTGQLKKIVYSGDPIISSIPTIALMKSLPP
ncbi:MAG: hypothetical protein IPJ88_14425 [Myxococcales bacterium]|nr:MAG: hypothetical protein IPJ88_14425 [Myxococcales bacterium]